MKHLASVVFLLVPLFCGALPQINNALKCYQCKGPNCGTTFQNTLKPCVNNVKGDSCVTDVIDEKNVIRGCKSDPNFVPSKFAAMCQVAGCNNHPMTHSAECISCSEASSATCNLRNLSPVPFGKACTIANSNTCKSIALLNRPIQCFTYKASNKIVRGCAKESGSLVLDKANYNICEGQLCNNACVTIKCVKCDSRTNPKCATQPNELTLEQCATNMACFNARTADGAIVRGCGAMLQEATENLPCFTDGCNKHLHPFLPVILGTAAKPLPPAPAKPLPPVPAKPLPPAPAKPLTPAPAKPLPPAPAKPLPPAPAKPLPPAPAKPLPPAPAKPLPPAPVKPLPPAPAKPLPPAPAKPLPPVPAKALPPAPAKPLTPAPAKPLPPAPAKPLPPAPAKPLPPAPAKPLPPAPAKPLPPAPAKPLPPAPAKPLPPVPAKPLPPAPAKPLTPAPAKPLPPAPAKPLPPAPAKPLPPAPAKPLPPAPAKPLTPAPAKPLPPAPAKPLPPAPAKPLPPVPAKPLPPVPAKPLVPVVVHRECHGCDSKNLAVCATNPSASLPHALCKDPKDQCVTAVVDGITRRGCEKELNLAKDAISAKCDSNLCNVKIFPENRLQCYQCQGKDCAKGFEKTKMPCVNYVKDDSCVTDVKDETTVTRKCLSDPGYSAPKLAVMCKQPGCNNQPPTYTAQCVSCSQTAGKPCTLTLEHTCETSVLLHRHAECFTYKAPNKVIRGCLKDAGKLALDKDNFEICEGQLCNNKYVPPTSGSPCKGNDCNKGTQTPNRSTEIIPCSGKNCTTNTAVPANIAFNGNKNLVVINFNY